MPAGMRSIAWQQFKRLHAFELDLLHQQAKIVDEISCPSISLQYESVGVKDWYAPYTVRCFVQIMANNMKHTLLFCILLLPAGALHAQSKLARIDSLTNFYATTFDFNGVVLVAEKGEIIFHQGYGYQDKDKNIRNGKDGLYLIGSVTKQFTAELILMLAKEGKLSLQDKLSKYFPDYKQADSVTLHQMLTHTSGIFDYTRNHDWEQMDLERPISDKQLWTLFQDMPLQFPPGSQHEYSNTNYKLLGTIIEQLTDNSYYYNLRKRIFQPLGMTSTGCDFTHLQHKNKTVGYYRADKDSFYKSIIVDSTHVNSAGAIYSTAADLFKWHQALQTNKLLPKEWQDKAYTPNLDNYGYGWDVDSVAGKYCLSHSGFIHGYNAVFYHIPGDDACIVVLTNMMKTGADPNLFAYNMVQALYDKDYAIPAPRQAIELSEALIKPYEGIYTFVEDSTVQLTCSLKDKQFYLQLGGQQQVPLLPQSNSMFFTRVVDAQIEFVKQDGGDYALILHQNGQDMKAVKLPSTR
jgi:CubicO group peptidase (beta-lactamase class C family)